ncbi:MAG: glycosyltransferase family 2 protein [Gammaproteobacteria bacterium]|nr:glycosyltransferase family 2 protein [Gammaproteobacteria bacterium]
MTAHTKIAVVVLNYNSAAFTLRCIESLRQHTTAPVAVNVVVVDNNSAPADKKLLTTIRPGTATLVWSERNLGFAGGMMLGARSVQAEYYFFLNNDCEFLNDVLSILTQFMEAHAEAALCSASMFDADDRPRSSFGYLPSLALMILGAAVLRLFQPRRYPRRHRLYRTPVEVPVVTGAAMFVRGSVLWQLSGLDTAYFLYCEEEDFAWRIRQAGRKVYHVPQARIRHVGGASSGQPELQAALQREYYISLFRFLRSQHGAVYAFALRLLVATKILRRALLGRMPFGLLGFVLRGAPENRSLRYRQNQ